MTRNGLLWLLSSLLFSACNEPGFELVSVSPIWSYEAGCTQVAIRGHGFGKEALVSVGGEALENIAWPPAGDIDDGYEITGQVPRGDAGPADVVVYNPDGASSGLEGGFTYTVCPAVPSVDAIAPVDDLAAGTAVTITGCALDPATHQVRLGGSTLVPIAESCRTAIVNFVAPDLPAGSYLFEIVDADGNALWPTEVCDSADTGGCNAPVYVTYGGAR